MAEDNKKGSLVETKDGVRQEEERSSSSAVRRMAQGSLEHEQDLPFVLLFSLSLLELKETEHEPPDEMSDELQCYYDSLPTSLQDLIDSSSNTRPKAQVLKVLKRILSKQDRLKLLKEVNDTKSSRENGTKMMSSGEAGCSNSKQVYVEDFPDCKPDRRMNVSVFQLKLPDFSKVNRDQTLHEIAETIHAQVYEIANQEPPIKHELGKTQNMRLENENLNDSNTAEQKATTRNKNSSQGGAKKKLKKKKKDKKDEQNVSTSNQRDREIQAYVVNGREKTRENEIKNETENKEQNVVVAAEVDTVASNVTESEAEGSEKLIENKNNEISEPKESCTVKAPDTQNEKLETTELSPEKAKALNAKQIKEKKFKNRKKGTDGGNTAESNIVLFDEEIVSSEGSSPITAKESLEEKSNISEVIMAKKVSPRDFLGQPIFMAPAPVHLMPSNYNAIPYFHPPCTTPFPPILVRELTPSECIGIGQNNDLSANDIDTIPSQEIYRSKGVSGQPTEQRDFQEQAIATGIDSQVLPSLENISKTGFSLLLKRKESDYRKVEETAAQIAAQIEEACCKVTATDERASNPATAEKGSKINKTYQSLLDGPTRLQTLKKQEETAAQIAGQIEEACCKVTATDERASNLATAEKGSKINKTYQSLLDGPTRLQKLKKQMRKHVRRQMWFELQSRSKLGPEFLQTNEMSFIQFKSSLPRYWQSSQSYQNFSSNGVFTLHDLPSSHPTYDYISTLFHHTCRSKIDLIQRIENPYLWLTYQLKRAEIIARSDGEEVQEMHLFHGTLGANVNSICKENLDWRRQGKNRFGQGICFSPSSEHASRYVDEGTLLVVKVMAGKIGPEGDINTKIPPGGFDSTQSSNKRVMVVYNDHCCYPEYLITFSRHT